MPWILVQVPPLLLSGGVTPVGQATSSPGPQFPQLLGIKVASAGVADQSWEAHPAHRLALLGWKQPGES